VVDSCVVKSNLGNAVEGGPSRDQGVAMPRIL
jgi:hypothetical protein